MANSQLTVNLSLITQDQLIPSPSPAIMVSRIIPPFSYASSGAIVYGGYQAMQPNTNLILVPSGTYAAFLFVRNTTQVTGNATNQLKFGLDVAYFAEGGVTDTTTVFPGGFIMVGNPQGLPQTGVTEVSLGVPTNGQPIVVEYLFAV